MTEPMILQFPVEPHHLDGMAALLAAGRTKTRRLKDERDTAFIKRIAAAYLTAHIEMLLTDAQIDRANKAQEAAE